MTINEVLSIYKELLKLNNRTPDYTDAYLWSIFCNTKADYLKNELKKNNFISPRAYHPFYLPLIDGNMYDGSCVNLSCPIKVTQTAIPSVVRSKTADALKILTPSNEKIDLILEEQIPNIQYNDIKKDRMFYYIGKDNKVYIINNTLLKCIKVIGLWDNILDFNNLQDPNSCVDVFSLDIGLGRDAINDIIKMSFDTYLKLNIQTDNTNDSNNLETP